jgi:hypothetical protein
MEDVKKQAELYAESFRYKVDDGSWYEQKVRDFIAGYEASLRIHDVSITYCDLGREFHQCEVHRCSTYGCLNCGQYHQQY